MRNLIRIGLTAALLAFAAVAHANDGVHWTVTGPTSVTFDWRGADSTLSFGLTTAYTRTVIARRPDPLPWSSTEHYWEAPISGLLPDTLYH